MNSKMYIFINSMSFSVKNIGGLISEIYHIFQTLFFSIYRFMVRYNWIAWCVATFIRDHI